MKKYIRKADIILFIVLVASGIAVSAALALSHAGAGSGSRVVIKSGGELFATYSLATDMTITVPAPGTASASASASEAESSASAQEATADGRSSAPDDECAQHSNFNTVEIKSGSVSVTDASCRNQVCVRHGAISRPGESIVCLPNRLVVTIEGSGKGGEYDSVTS